MNLSELCGMRLEQHLALLPLDSPLNFTSISFASAPPAAMGKYCRGRRPQKSGLPTWLELAPVMLEATTIVGLYTKDRWHIRFDHSRGESSRGITHWRVSRLQVGRGHPYNSAYASCIGPPDGGPIIVVTKTSDKTKGTRSLYIHLFCNFTASHPSIVFFGVLSLASVDICLHAFFFLDFICGV